MNKKLLFFGLLLITGLGLILKDSFKGESEVEQLRKQHAEFLQNHPYQKTAELPKKQRKAQGLPPNAFFEQKYLSEINPATGRTNKEKLYELQEKLNNRRAASKVPGEADNPWIERGPDNVGGRTRAVIFDPNDATNETVFAGGVSGGLWKNTKISEASSKWERVGIPENLAVSCIVVDPNDSKTFYVGTGESYVNGDVNGDGVWKSTDGGSTWNRVFGGVTGQSFLDPNSTVTVNSPASIAGVYISTLATAFGGNLSSPVTGDLALVEDDTAPTSDACSALVNNAALNGKIAVIRRGSCNFDDKVKRAQDGGAIAVIMVNNVEGNPIPMGGDDATITIPSLMTTKTAGESMITALGSGTVNVTLTKGADGAVNSLLVPGVQHVNDIVIRNNGGTSEVFVAAGEAGYTGGASLGGKSFGVYKSTDGTNFTKLSIPKTTNGNEYEPNNLEIASDNSIFLSTTRSFSFGDGGGAIFKSSNGTTFNLVQTVTDGVRTEIALSPTNAAVGYVLAQTSTTGSPVKIYKTTDGFVTITELPLPNDADTGIPANDFTRGQAFYDLLIKVDPNNENTLYVGGIDLFKSTTGGTSWNQISHWYGGFSQQYVHADQHGIAFASSSRMVFSNDGGVYFSNNGGGLISARNRNYNTVQFYTVGVGPTAAFNGKDYFLAGAQDNGTPYVADAQAGINSSVDVSGGDGAASFFDTDGTDRYYIANYVYNQSIELTNLATNQKIIVNNEDASNGDFINQEELDSHLNILYSNYSSGNKYQIRRYADLLGTITKEILVNGLMTAEPSVLKISPHTTTSSNLFVGLKNGKLLKVEKANEATSTWTEITGPDFVGSMSDIEFGVNENQILVTFHNYGVKSVWYTNDGGTTWKNKEGNLPDIPVKSILQNPLNPKEVIIGTDLGVWKTDNFDADAPTWTQSYNGMSNVPVLDLDLRDDNVVFAATYGRGVFSGKFSMDPNGDLDGDGVLNGVDNCPTTANADQKDSDGNGVGDACQDTDGDGVLDTVDNCPTTANSDQKDTDGNGVGDACQDTDGDGVMDNVDNCINTKNADQADGNNDGVGDVCDTSYEDQTNITTKVTSETCAEQKDGKIEVTVKQTFVNYTVTLNGTGKNETKNIAGSATTTVFENLSPGAYEICVSVDGRSYTQCYEFNVDAAAPISLRVAKKQASKEYTININKGTAPYNVYLNGNLVGTFNSKIFDVQVAERGILEVKTAKACEGAFKTVIDGIFLKKNPISTKIELLIPSNFNRDQVETMIYDLSGKVIFNQAVRVSGNTLDIPFENYNSGIYILKLGVENSEPIKILKQ